MTCMEAELCVFDPYKDLKQDFKHLSVWFLMSQAKNKEETTDILKL